MNASIRTLIYAAVAVGFAVAAYATHKAMLPSDPEGFNLVGQEFYPGFKEPAKAARLRVAAYDDLKEASRVFTVEKSGDKWRIPSHHDYPAEAKKRLAETAASVMGIKREAVAGRGEAEHERYGVIDPLDEESTAIRGRGQRITLFDEGGKELVDLIVGKQVEGQGGQFYVRLPAEKETYRAALNVKLSTKFSDWIEPDLLKLTTSDLVALRSSKPIIEEKVIQTPLGRAVSEQQTGEEKVELTRKDSSSDWQLADLNESVEEFDDGPVSTVVSTVDDLKIIGVRPKPRGIRADFTLDIPEDLRKDPFRARQFAQQQVRALMDKGFAILADDKEQPYISAREGELVAVTKDGVVYNLHFGNRFEGSLDDIEFGAATDDAADEDKPDKNAAGKEKKPDEAGPEAASDKSADADAKDDADADDDDDVQEGRYVLVRVEFDPKYIGEEPVAPVEPTKPPAEDKPKEPAADAAKPKDAADDADAKKEAEQKDPAEESDETDAKEKTADDSKPGDAKPDDAKPDEKPEEKKSPAQLAYEEAMKDYESENIKYISDKQDYEKKVAEGKKQVERLNQRFQDWYYVISAENFETLRLSRAKLVKSKDVAEQPPVEAPNPSAAAQPDKE